MLSERSLLAVLLGGVDEVTPSLYQILQNIDCAGKAGANLTVPAPDTADQKAVWGEGASFFVLSAKQTPTCLASIEGYHTFYQPKVDRATIDEEAMAFLQSVSLKPEEIDAIMMGYNGYAAEDKFYLDLHKSLFPDKPVLSFKNLCGEYFTASAFGLHLAAKTLQHQQAFPNTLLAGELKQPLNKLLLYNLSQGRYHSLILLSRCQPL